MDILKRLSGVTDGMSNADVYKLVRDEIITLRAKLEAQPTPNQVSLPKELNIDDTPCHLPQAEARSYMNGWNACLESINESTQPTSQRWQAYDHDDGKWFTFDSIEEAKQVWPERNVIRPLDTKPQPTPSQSGEKELLAEYDAVLRALCSYVSAGGYNDEADQLINPQVANEKIRWGIDHLLQSKPKHTSQDAERLRYLHSYHSATGQIVDTPYEQWIANIDAMKERNT